MPQQQVVEIARPGGLQQLKLTRRDIPRPQPHEVVIRNSHAGIAFAEVLMRQGLYPGVPRRHLVPGYDVAGTVMAVGEQVRDLRPGQAVVALTQTGGYAQFTAVDAVRVVAKPASIANAEAVALVLNYVTAYQMLTRVARIQAGESLLVHGPLGGVGGALVQLGKHFGCNVYGTLSERKWRQSPPQDFIAIPYQSEPFEQALRQRAPEGVDVVFDAIGGSHLKRSVSAVKPGGRVVTYGFHTSIRNGRRRLLHAAREWLMSLTAPLGLMSHNQALMGYNVWGLALARPDWFQEDMRALLALCESGAIKPLVAQVLPLHQAQEAHRLLQSAEVVGKLVLDCGA